MDSIPFLYSLFKNARYVHMHTLLTMASAAAHQSVRDSATMHGPESSLIISDRLSSPSFSPAFTQGWDVKLLLSPSISFSFEVPSKGIRRAMAHLEAKQKLPQTRRIRASRSHISFEKSQILDAKMCSPSLITSRDRPWRSLKAQL